MPLTDMEEILSAVISAIAAILVALINKSSGRSRERQEAAQLQPASQRVWLISFLIVTAWLLVSPIVIHPDFQGINVIALIPATLFVVAIWPTTALTVAAWVLALHALNSVAEPLARMVLGASLEDAFTGYSTETFVLILTLAFANALGAGLLARWRLSSLAALRERLNQQPGGPARDREQAQQPDPETAPNDFLASLEKLAELHRKGALSEEEYSKAKQRVLGRQK